MSRSSNERVVAAAMAARRGAGLRLQAATLYRPLKRRLRRLGHERGLPAREHHAGAHAPPVHAWTQAHRAAMRLRDLAHDRQTEAGAFRPGGGAEERLENARTRLRGNAASVVEHFER